MATNPSHIPSRLLGTVVILLRNGKILLGKRKNSYMSGFYGLPGGRIELSEKLVDGAKRELIEETGIKADSLEYVGVVRDFQDNYSFTHFAFLCKDFNGEPKLSEPEKCEAWEWFNPKEIPENILPGHKAAIEMFTTQIPQVCGILNPKNHLQPKNTSGSERIVPKFQPLCSAKNRCPQTLVPFSPPSDITFL